MNLFQKLVGWKTYILAASAILAAIGAYLDQAMTLTQMIEAVFAALGTMTVRHAITTTATQVVDKTTNTTGNKISSLILFMILFTGGIAFADTTIPTGDITTALDKVVLNQGAIYTLKANSVSYTMTTDLVSWKGLSLIGGYSAAAKAVAGIDYDLLNLSKYVTIPLLKYVDIHIGWAATWDNIGGRNVVDEGPIVTIAQLSF